MITRSAWKSLLSCPAPALQSLWVVLVQDSICGGLPCLLCWQVHGLAWEILQSQPSTSPFSFGTPKGNGRALAECPWATCQSGSIILVKKARCSVYKYLILALDCAHTCMYKQEYPKKIK